MKRRKKGALSLSSLPNAIAFFLGSLVGIRDTLVYIVFHGEKGLLHFRVGGTFSILFLAFLPLLVSPEKRRVKVNRFSVVKKSSDEDKV